MNTTQVLKIHWILIINQCIQQTLTSIVKPLPILLSPVLLQPSKIFEKLFSKRLSTNDSINDLQYGLRAE